MHYKDNKNTSRVMLPPLLLLHSAAVTAAATKTTASLARRSQATYIQLNLEFHHLSRVDAKQLCALAHLGSTCKAGTF